jgi:hypothetical protein
LLQAYSAMTVYGNGTSGGSTYNISASYNTVYHSSTTYKVAITLQEAGNSINYTVWVQNDGTVLAVGFSAGGFTQNLTGSEGQSAAAGAFAEFTLQIQADSLVNYYTNQGYFHTTGTSTVSIGPTSVKVTTYAANSLPETINDCNGDTTTLTQYSFSVGTPQGSSVPLVVYEHFDGSDNVNGTVTNYDYVQQVTSITLA